MGYLKRFGDGKYRICYNLLPEGGRRRQKRETLNGVSKKEAYAILAAREAKILAQRRAIESGEAIKDEIQLADLFEGFMKAKRTNKESTTVKRYDSLVSLYLIPRFGSMKAGTLKPFHLTSAYTDWQINGRDGKVISPTTIRHVHSLLRNALNWGVRGELLTRNVAPLVGSDDLPKATKPKPTALTQAELDRLLEEAKNPTERSKKRGYLSAQSWFYPAIMFAAFTGARRGEVLALRWSDIDFERRSVTIARAITERLEIKAPKNDRTREIEVRNSLLNTLRAHREEQQKDRVLMGKEYNDGDLVFARADGSPVNPWNFCVAVRDCIKRSGVTPITLHGLRDTHASLLAQAGISIEVISKRLGHSSIGVTVERYLHIYRGRDGEAADAFERLFG